MTTHSAVAGDSTNVAHSPTRDSKKPKGGGKQPISPAERWALICKNVYSRAQKRGFVGGNPLQDLADAEQAVDAAFETDFQCVFSLTSTDDVTEQLKGLFAGFGVDQENLEGLLDGHRESLEKLTALNRQFLHGASTLVVDQTRLLKNVVDESVKALQSFTHGPMRPKGVFNLAELSMQAFDNALMGFRISSRSVKTLASSSLLHDALNRNYQGRSARQLVEAPVTAIKGISASLASSLKEEFGISTIGAMATNRQAQWARAVVLLADVAAAADAAGEITGGGSSADPEKCNRLLELSDAAITEVCDMGERQARLLQREFGIVTVRDLGTDPRFDAAFAIITLAALEV